MPGSQKSVARILTGGRVSDSQTGPLGMIYQEKWIYPCLSIKRIGFLLGLGVPYAEHYKGWHII